jgi:hypothetical protein
MITQTLATTMVPDLTLLLLDGTTPTCEPLLPLGMKPPSYAVAGTIGWVTYLLELSVCRCD